MHSFDRSALPNTGERDTPPATGRGDRRPPASTSIDPPRGVRTLDFQGRSVELIHRRIHNLYRRPCSRRQWLTPPSPRSSPWTTCGRPPRTVTWTGPMILSRRTRSSSTNPTPPGAPTSLGRSSPMPIPRPKSNQSSDSICFSTPARSPSLPFSDLQVAIPSTLHNQVPSPAVGRAEQPRRCRHLPHRARRRGQRH